MVCTAYTVCTDRPCEMLLLLLAFARLAVVSLRALEVIVALTLRHANVVHTDISCTTAVTRIVAGNPGDALAAGANRPGETLGIIQTLLKRLRLAVAKGIAELIVIALAVRATNGSGWATLALSVNITGLSQLALRIDLASEMLTATTPAFRVTDIAIFAMRIVLAAIALLGLAGSVAAAFAVIAFVVGFALGALSLLADPLRVAKVTLVTTFVVLANGDVDCLANSPVGADLAPFAVRVLLAVGENNLLTVTVLIANLAVLAILVCTTLSSIVNLTGFVLTSRTWYRLTDAVGVAHFAGLALSAAFALGAFAGFTDGFGAAAALGGAVVLTAASPPEAMIHICGIRVPVSPSVV